MTDASGTLPVFDADIVVIGAGAAGLMSAIHAGRAMRRERSNIVSSMPAPTTTASTTSTTARVVVLDGAHRIGIKFLLQVVVVAMSRTMRCASRTTPAVLRRRFAAYSAASRSRIALHFSINWVLS